MGRLVSSRVTWDELSYPYLIRLALPVIGMQFVLQLMNFIEAIFAGQMELNVLNAVNTGSIFYSILSMICFAFGIGFQIQISRYRSRHRRLDAQSFLFHYGWLYGITLVVLLSVGMGFGIWFQLSEDAYRETLGRYIFWRSLGLLPVAILYPGRAFFISIGRTEVLFYNGILMAVLSVLVNAIAYWKGMLSLEVILIASLIGEVGGALHIIYMYGKNQDRIALTSLMGITPRRLYFRKLLFYLLPLVIQYTFGLTSWFLFFQWLVYYGSNALGASSVFKNLYQLCLLPGFGLNAVLNSVGAHLLAKRNASTLLLLYRRAIVLNAIFILPLLGSILLFPDLFIRFFTKDKVVVELVHSFYWLLVPIIGTFAISTPAFNVLLSTGRTVYSMFAELSSVGCYLLALIFLIWWWHVHFQWVWIAEIVYWGVLWVFSFGMLQWMIWQYESRKEEMKNGKKTEEK
jgi:Na+-driven multidrug efflux pump